MRPPTLDIAAPEFPPRMRWVNVAFLRMDKLAGENAVLVEFWDYARANCLRVLPHLHAWHRRYREHGLRVIGVHTPEFSFAADPDAVEAAVRRLGIEFPVLVDADFEVWRLYGNKGWPARYLWDRNGALRWYHYGEGEYVEAEQAIQEALREIHSDPELPPPLEPLADRDRPGARLRRPTADVFLGAARGGVPAEVSLRGDWRHGDEAIAAGAEGAGLALRYEAGGANAVLAPPPGGQAAVEVRLDGAPVPEQLRGANVSEREGRTVVEVEAGGMASLVAEDAHAGHVLELVALGPGLRIHVLTFEPALA